MIVRSLREGDIDALECRSASGLRLADGNRRRLETYLATRTIASLVADVDGEPVGCVFCVTYGTAVDAGETIVFSGTPVGTAERRGVRRAEDGDLAATLRARAASPRRGGCGT